MKMNWGLQSGIPKATGCGHSAACEIRYQADNAGPIRGETNSTKPLFSIREQRMTLTGREI